MLLSGVLGSALVVLASLAWQAAAGRASMGAVSGRFVGLAFANSILLSIVNAATVTAPRYASSAEVGLVTPLEAILGPIWVYIGVGETPSKWTIMGGALLVGSLIGHEVWGYRSEAHSSKRAAAATATTSSHYARAAEVYDSAPFHKTAIQQHTSAQSRIPAATSTEVARDVAKP